MQRRMGVLAATGYHAAAQTGRAFLIGAGAMLVSLQSQAQTALEIFNDKAVS